jgi:glycosyltransferase involved in cell wall biosynthesis
MLGNDASRSRELISVLLPVYNAEPFLPLAIESLLRQTHENLEIIAIDDGSSDGSGVSQRASL